MTLFASRGGTSGDADDEGSAKNRRARDDFLVGGGAMAKLIQSMDGSTTPLGPMASWPQSLRTTLSLARASNSPISIAWGPGHVQIYNDGYWPICGAKHPESMGQDFRTSASCARARSAWPSSATACSPSRASRGPRCVAHRWTSLRSRGSRSVA